MNHILFDLIEVCAIRIHIEYLDDFLPFQKIKIFIIECRKSHASVQIVDLALEDIVDPHRFQSIYMNAHIIFQTVEKQLLCRIEIEPFKVDQAVILIFRYNAAVIGYRIFSFHVF